MDENFNQYLNIYFRVFCGGKLIFTIKLKGLKLKVVRFQYTMVFSYAMVSLRSAD